MSNDISKLLGPFAEQEIEWAHKEVDRLRIAKGLKPLYSKESSDTKNENTSKLRLADSD